MNLHDYMYMYTCIIIFHANKSLGEIDSPNTNAYSSTQVVIYTYMYVCLFYIIGSQPKI